MLISESNQVARFRDAIKGSRVGTAKWAWPIIKEQLEKEAVKINAQVRKLAYAAIYGNECHCVTCEVYGGDCPFQLWFEVNSAKVYRIRRAHTRATTGRKIKVG